jgi:hypothetical protein
MSAMQTSTGMCFMFTDTLRLRRMAARLLCAPALGAALALTVADVAAPRAAAAQWVTTYEQFYLQAPHNWVFRNRYPAADRLFNAFDYGHAILYEVLWNQPGAPPSVLEEKEYERLTKRILVNPPRVPLAEAAIEVRYAKLAPEAKMMFHWAHLLHRQMYDILADERLDDARKDAEVARLLAYYRTRPDLAFSEQPKSMKLMQEQPYSLAFRKDYPKFNGLIWAYHWLQVGLYEPLVVGRTSDERQAGVRATVARFWQMLPDAPATMPHQMPMTAAVAPRFSARYPEVAIIFDNLHSMHDVISDILANDAVPQDRKRAEIMRAARLFRDDTSYVMSREAWLAMSDHMGIENMGGPAVGFLPDLPTPTVTYGAVMNHDDRTGAMTGFSYGGAVGDAHAGHAAPGAAADPHAGHVMPPAAAVADPHAGHVMPPAAADPHAGHVMPGMAGAPMEQVLQVYIRMLSDPVMRQRIQGDTTTRRMVEESISALPAEHHEHLRQLLREPPPAGEASAVRIPVSKGLPAPARPAATTRPATPPRPAPAKPATTPPVDPHAGHVMPPPPPTRPPAGTTRPPA